MKNVNVLQDGFSLYLLTICFLLYVIHYMKPSATFSSVVARRALPLQGRFEILYIKLGLRRFFYIYRYFRNKIGYLESVYFITIKYIKAQARCLCHQVYGMIVTVDDRIAAVSTENIKEEVVYG